MVAQQELSALNHLVDVWLLTGTTAVSHVPDQGSREGQKGRLSVLGLIGICRSLKTPGRNPSVSEDTGPESVGLLRHGRNLSVSEDTRSESVGL